MSDAKMMSYPRIFIAAGEHSGDRYGAALTEKLRDLCPDARVTGIGGPRMRDAGVRMLADTVGHSGMGLRASAENIHRWAAVYRRCISEFNREPPDVLVPIDNPGFNLRLARLCHDRGIFVCYYVSPQVWAWLPSRIHRIAKIVNRMMVIFSFEEEMYRKLGVDCRFVGHPLLDYLAAQPVDERFMGDLAGNGKTPVGLLPGSRSQEIRNTFRVICLAAKRLADALPNVTFNVAAASADHMSLIAGVMKRTGFRAPVHVGRTPEIMKASRICLSVTGTATLETAWYGTPMVVVYRTAGWVRYPARWFLNVPHVCLVNILAGREVTPEFLQHKDDPAPVASAALNLLQDAQAWETCRQAQAEVVKSLGSPGSSLRAAEAVLQCVSRHRR